MSLLLPTGSASSAVWEERHLGKGPGMPASGNLSRVSGRAAYRETLGYPTRLGMSASCVAVSADLSDRWHQRVTLACGHQRRHLGTRGRPQKPNKGHWQTSEGKDSQAMVPRDLVSRIRGSVPAAVIPDAWGRGSRGLGREPSTHRATQRGAVGRECAEPGRGGG